MPLSVTPPIPALDRPPRLSLAVSNGSPRRSPPARAGGFYVAHSVQARFGILPLARLQGRRDGTGNPSPLTVSHIKAPGREPGDCGNEGHPA